MDKQKKLDQIAEEIKKCQICKKGKSGRAVPGEGNPDAEIVFIGEAPGRTEAETGRPFIGRSGQYLRENIRKVLDLKEKEIYITSPVKYLPNRGTPTRQDIAHGRIHLMRQLDVIKPKIVVLMGSVAAQGVLEEKIPVMKKHGTTLKKSGETFFLTLHPTAAIRFAPLRKFFHADFRKLKSIIKTK